MYVFIQNLMLSLNNQRKTFSQTLDLNHRPVEGSPPCYQFPSDPLSCWDFLTECYCSVGQLQNRTDAKGITTELHWDVWDVERTHMWTGLPGQQRAQGLSVPVVGVQIHKYHRPWTALQSKTYTQIASGTAEIFALFQVHQSTHLCSASTNKNRQSHSS